MQQDKTEARGEAGRRRGSRGNPFAKVTQVPGTSNAAATTASTGALERLVRGHLTLSEMDRGDGEAGGDQSLSIPSVRMSRNALTPSP